MTEQTPSSVNDAAADDEDRDDPFDSDITSEEDSDELMPEREESKANDIIQQELHQQEIEATNLINQELALSGTEAIDVLP